MGVSNAFGDKILSAKFAKSDLGVWGDCCVSSGGSSDFILEGVKFPEDHIFRLPGRSQINITHLHDPPTHLLRWLHSHSFVRATVFSFVSWSAAVYPVSSDSLSIWVCLLWFETILLSWAVSRSSCLPLTPTLLRIVQLAKVWIATGPQTQTRSPPTSIICEFLWFALFPFKMESKRIPIWPKQTFIKAPPQPGGFDWESGGESVTNEDRDEGEGEGWRLVQIQVSIDFYS